jgi:hypothetical protein
MRADGRLGVRMTIRIMNDRGQVKYVLELELNGDASIAPVGREMGKILVFVSFLVARPLVRGNKFKMNKNRNGPGSLVSIKLWT